MNREVAVLLVAFMPLVLAALFLSIWAGWLFQLGIAVALGVIFVAAILLFASAKNLTNTLDA